MGDFVPDPANQVGQQPRIPDSDYEGNKVGFQPSGNLFKSGEQWSLFMPGQSGGVKGVDNPTVWPSPGTLLRVPKCVFLTSVPPAHLWGEQFTLMTKWQPYGYFGHWFDSEARDVRFTPPSSVIEGSELFDGQTGTFAYLGWAVDPQYNTDLDGPRKWEKVGSITNASFEEHNRLQEVFAEVKEILEAQYPNQIYIYITQFFPSNPVRAIGPNDENEPLVLDVVSQEGIAANTPPDFCNGPLWILGPDQVDDRSQFQVPPSPKFEANFFGTNFLHIYAGYQCLAPLLAGDNAGPNDLSGMINRLFFANTTTMGNPLDGGVVARINGYSPWKAATEDPLDGYEGTASYDFMLNYVESKGFAAESVDNPVRNLPIGKGAKLQSVYNNFAGYSCALFQYDATYGGNYAGLSTASGSQVSDGATGTPPYVGPTNYSVQSWVENYRFNIGQVMADIQNDAALGLLTYSDYHFEPGNGLYNYYTRYPSTEQMAVFTNYLQQQYTLMTTALNGLGPKTAEMWATMIDTYDLADYGFSNPGGSSLLTVEYLVDYIKSHYGLQ
jgi:hypothetical protein